MRPFVYDQPSIRYAWIFGAYGKSIVSAAECRPLSAQRHALVLASPGQRPAAEAAARQLGAVAAGIYVPSRRRTCRSKLRGLALRSEARRSSTADSLRRRIGGGSTIGLGKSVALERGLAARRGADRMLGIRR